MPLVRKPAAVATRPSPARLDNPDAELRWAAARAATADDALRLAAAARAEVDPRVREAQLSSLARIGTVESAHLLISLLRSDDAALRTGALDALGILETTADNDYLPTLLHDPDIDVRILSCELARRRPAEAATRLLSDLLDREQDVNVCAAAIDVLTEVGEPLAVPHLEACAKRFQDSPFLAFAASTAIERLNVRSASARD